MFGIITEGTLDPQTPQFVGAALQADLGVDLSCVGTKWIEEKCIKTFKLTCMHTGVLHACVTAYCVHTVPVEYSEHWILWNGNYRHILAGNQTQVFYKSSQCMLLTSESSLYPPPQIHLKDC